MHETPAQTVLAILGAMESLGVELGPVRASLPEGDPRPGELWPTELLVRAWARAAAQLPRPTLAAEVGRATPFGAFGVVDYLAASADTFGGSLHALTTHFRGITADPSLALRPAPDGARLEVRLDAAGPRWMGEEFTLAVSLKNFRHVLGGGDALADAVVAVTRPDPAPGALEGAFGARVDYSAPVASLWFPAASLALPTRTADPQLRYTLGLIAASMGLGGGADPFEAAIRARLRDLLPQGDVAAATMARCLGTSERTLHRRLQEHGTTWRAVIDAFRADESRRLLREGRRALADIALAVGFADQTAWTRAFRRQVGQSPSAWARGQSGTVK